MSTENGPLRTRVERLQEEVSRLAMEAGTGAPPRIVGVTKGRSPDLARDLFDAGVPDLAENRWEQLEEKDRFFRLQGRLPQFHFIGALQRRSLRHLYRPVFRVETVDRHSIIPVLSDRVLAFGVVQEILIEVDLTGIPGRSGVSVEMLETLLEEIGKWPNLVVSGLMVMGPPPGDRTASLKVFGRARELFDRVFTGGEATLSMGMTDDYREAVVCGATEIRVGRYFFEEAGKERS
ncbi:MAG: type III PLP-dependent enzyme domain-containing protein [Leptospirales bacterium]